jgi:uncharacterized membrane protein SirB2
MPLLVAQFAASCFLAGLIWTIQVVHYPLMAQVGPERFAEYERLHSMRITPLVGPAMLIELGLTLLLLAHRPTAVAPWMTWTGAALVLVIWLTTFLISVPCHATLSQGFDAIAHARLVDTNWIRTVAWTARAALAGWMLWCAWEAGKN